MAPSHEDGAQLTTLLNRWRELQSCPDAARESIMASVYRELRRLARAQLVRERRVQTLTPTALVHEAYLRLSAQEGFSCKNRLEFFGLATMVMRRVLVDYARKRLAAKRGAGLTASTLTESDSAAESARKELDAEEAIAVHDSLDRLATVDERQAKIVELRYFGGFTTAEIAELMGISEQDTDREWRIAKAWLGRRLRGLRPNR